MSFRLSMPKPYASSLAISRCWGRQSYAFERSISAMAVTPPPLSIQRRNISITRKRACWVLCPFSKAQRIDDRLFSMNGRIRFKSRRSKTFDSDERTLIGRKFFFTEASPLLNTGGTSACFTCSGNMHCSTISLASLVTALKERSEVN